MLIILIYYLNITRESQLKKDLKKLMFKRYLKKKKKTQKIRIFGRNEICPFQNFQIIVIQTLKRGSMEKRNGQSGDETNFNWLLVESKRPVTVAAL